MQTDRKVNDMKQVYVVMDDGYKNKPLMAYEARNDAVRTACAIHECAADEASDYIKAIPIMYDQPQTIALTDVQTIVDVTLKAVESASRITQEGK